MHVLGTAVSDVPLFFLRHVIDHLKCISNFFQASTARLTDMIATSDMPKPVIIPFIECLLQSSTIELAYQGPITIFFDQLVVHIITEDFAVIKPDASPSSVSFTRLYPELNTILIFTTYKPVADICVGGHTKHEYYGNLDMICELKWSSCCAAADKISGTSNSLDYLNLFLSSVSMNMLSSVSNLSNFSKYPRYTEFVFMKTDLPLFPSP